MPYTDDILKALRRKKYSAATWSELAKALSAPPLEHEAFKANIEALEYAGKVVRLKGKKYSLPGRAGLVVGKVDIARGGFGFLVPLDRDRHRQDYYISQRDLASATDGDLVAAKLSGRRGKFGQPSARVEYIVKRHRVNFVGTYRESPEGPRVLVDGGTAIREINISTEGAEATDGEKVVVEVLSWARPGSVSSGRVVEVLGRADDPTTDTLAVIREFDLPLEFEAETLAEAERIGEEVTEEQLAGRLDLRDRTVITIDPASARDFDDAISIKRTADGWLLGVHIADVSEYVPPGSALDKEAARRATSVYLPTRVIPMLPHSISNGIASLRENVDRLTKTVILRYNKRGEILGHEIHKSVIRSAKRMTYEEVAAVMAGRKPEGLDLTDEAAKLLAEAATLAAILEKRRFEAGMLELDLPEVDIEIDAGGEVTAVKPTVSDESHKLIEMFMVAANEAVAEILTRRKLPHLRRVHEGPSADDLQALKIFLTSLGFVIRDTSDRHQLQDILNRAKGRPEAHVMNLAVLKSMQRAEYSHELKGHYALASPRYSHYTSPIRRYADLVVHQVLDEYLTGRFDDERKAWWSARIPQIALRCSELSRRAEAAERELTKLKILRYLDKHGTGEFEGIVSGIKAFGVFVELSGYVVDGFIHVSELGQGPMRFEPRGRRLMSKKKRWSIRLGDPVVVAIKDVDLSSRKLDLELIRKIKGRERR